MTGKYPQLVEGRDGPREMFKMVNQLRRWVPLPTRSIQPAGPIDLLTTGLTSILPPNATGWVSTEAYLLIDELDGVLGVSPFISVGSTVTHDNIVAVTTIGIPVVDEAVFLSVVLSASITDEIFFNVDTAATGPTKFTGTVYLGGFYR